MSGRYNIVPLSKTFALEKIGCCEQSAKYEKNDTTYFFLHQPTKTEIELIH